MIENAETLLNSEIRTIHVPALKTYSLSLQNLKDSTYAFLKDEEPLSSC